MTSNPATERVLSLVTATGLVQRGGIAISAMTLDGGTAATGGTAVINDSPAGAGTDKWALRADQYGSASVTFSKPIPLTDGLYVTLTGTASRLSVSYA